MDTGSGHDLLSRELAATCKNNWRRWHQILFQTANGNVSRNTILPATADVFGGKDVNLYVMNENPSVLSVGMRCMEQGFWFIWIPSKMPCCISPDLQIIPCDVIKHAPYIRSANSALDRTQIHRLTGVSTARGRVKLSMPSDAVIPALAGPGDDDGASATFGVGYNSDPANGDGERLAEPDEASSEESDWESDCADPVRRCLRSEAASIDHKRNHKPYNPNCDGCVVGKTRNRRKKLRAGKEPREPAGFGEIATCDHVYMKNWFGMPSVGGVTDTLNFLDLVSNVKYSHPLDGRNTLETFSALQHIKGPDDIKILYHDNDKAIKKASRKLRIPPDLSQPGVHETNAKIERANQDILQGTRACLTEAGFPACFWTFACPCYCFLDNIAADEFGTSAWQARHGERLPVPISSMLSAPLLARMVQQIPYYYGIRVGWTFYQLTLKR